MAGLPTSMRAFYSPELYQALRNQATGWGIRYSLVLLLSLAAAVAVYFLVHDAISMRELQPDSLLLILLIAMVLRAVMLAALTLAARLITAVMRTPLSNAAAARVAAVSYTPVALFDAIAFCATGVAVSPPVLFGGGVVMLLAAVWASQ